MPDDLQIDHEWQTRLEPVYRLYAAIVRHAHPDTGLGGKLLYAGELHEDGCRLVRAGNVAGAASLSATVDPTALRHANRDGVADFLVTSLDEALRILKNEIRKKQAVSVGVSVSPAAMVAEMIERGVLPDLLPPAAWAGVETHWEFAAHGARTVPVDDAADGTFLAWSPAPTDFERLVLSVLPADDSLNRRWLHLSPRYLGPAARRVRSLACTAEVAARIAEALAARQAL